MFGHEILLPMLEIVGPNPSYSDGQQVALQVLAAGDQVNVLDFSGVNVSQDFVLGLLEGVRRRALPNESYSTPSASMQFRNLNATSRNLFQQMWFQYGQTITD